MVPREETNYFISNSISKDQYKETDQTISKDQTKGSDPSIPVSIISDGLKENLSILLLLQRNH